MALIAAKLKIIRRSKKDLFNIQADVELSYPDWLPNEFKSRVIIDPVLSAIKKNEYPENLNDSQIALYQFIKDVFDSYEAAVEAVPITLGLSQLDFLEDELTKEYAQLQADSKCDIETST